MNETKKGTIKREVGNIEIKDFEVSEIIINALLKKGYELLAKTIINDMQVVIGEKITIYRVEQR
jgi:hypothetical protein